jgi:hypothetical protein
MNISHYRGIGKDFNPKLDGNVKNTRFKGRKAQVGECEPKRMNVQKQKETKQRVA